MSVQVEHIPVILGKHSMLSFILTIVHQFLWLFQSSIRFGSIAKAPLLVALAYCLIMTGPGQVDELIRSEVASVVWPELARTGLALLCFCSLILVLCNDAIYMFPYLERDQRTKSAPPPEHWSSISWGPYIFCAIVLLTTVDKYIFTTLSAADVENTPPVGVFFAYAGACLLILYYVDRLEKAMLLNFGRFRPLYLTARTKAIGVIIPSGICVAATLIVFLVLHYTGTIDGLFGPMLILLNASTVVLVLIVGLQKVAIRTKFPWLGLVVFFALSFSILGAFLENLSLPIRLTSNAYMPEVSEIALRPAAVAPLFRCAERERQRPDAPLNTLEEAQQRLTGFAGPNITIAAQGGGMFAAFHTALTLARLQDECDDFVDHLFIASGVSGGALGLTVFFATVDFVRWYRTQKFITQFHGEQDDPCRHHSTSSIHEAIVTCFFSSDLMTPVLAAGLFLDVTNNFLPYKAIPTAFGWKAPNRGVALERAIVASWDKSVRQVLKLPAELRIPNLLLEPLATVRATRSWMPNLVFSATSVANGRPALITDFPFSVNGSLLTLSAPEWSFNPNLAQATVVSATFPYILPLARVRRVRDDNYLELMDGGYADSSAVGPLIEAEKAVGVRLARQKLKHILFVNSVPPSLKLSLLSELSAPIRTGVNAGIYRGFQNGKSFSENCFGRCVEFELLDGSFSPPLAWSISSATRSDVSRRSALFGKHLDDSSVSGALNGYRVRNWLGEPRADY